MDYDLWLRFAGLAEPAFIPQILASFRWHRESKSGSRYRAMAWECLRIAWSRARGADRLAVAGHLLHTGGQLGVYAVYDLISAVRPRTSE